MNNEKVYEIITQDLIKYIEENEELPWNLGLINGQAFDYKNVQGREYSGCNRLILYLTSYVKEYKNLHWGTFNQINKLNGKVRKGEKSTIIIFYTTLIVHKESGKKIKYKEYKTLDGNVKSDYDTFPVARYYRVFNVEQVEWQNGMPDNLKIQINEDVEPIKEAEKMLGSIKNMVKFKSNGYNKAYYHPKEDYISVPDIDLFESVEEYYETVYHEAVHATGHESRLKRFTKSTKKMDSKYSFEELIAEIGASFLRGKTGINDEDRMKNSAGYVKNWLKKLKDDPSMIVKAAARAQKAVQYIENR